MTTLHEKIKNELTNRLEKANFKEISITMKKSGDKIFITPCTQMLTIESMDDIEYFLLQSTGINLLGCDTIDELATTIQNYETQREHDLGERDRLKEYYETNIKGHNKIELADGNKYSIKLHEDWLKQPEMSYEDFEAQYDIASLDPQKTIDEIKSNLSLSHAWSFYSDWHKDLYGVRPHYM